MDKKDEGLGMRRRRFGYSPEDGRNIRIDELLSAANPEDEPLWREWLDKFRNRRRVLWYASAGEDFNPFTFYFREGATLERPDLIVYSSLGLEYEKQLRASLYPAEELTVIDHPGVMTVSLGPRARLRINRDRIRYFADPKKITFGDDPLELGSDHDAWAAEVRFNIHKEGVDEIFPLIYFKMENNNFLDEFILRLRVFEVEGLCTICEGCGLGGCRHSVIQTIYGEGAPDFYRSRGFKPQVVFAFNDFTRDIFVGNTRGTGVRILESWHYSNEGSVYSNEGTVFVLGY
jgi:hypothetical protein